MGRARTLTPLVLLGCVAGCASWTVKSEASSTSSYGQYRTYAWTTPSGFGDVDRLLDQHVRDQVTGELARRGIVPAADGAPPDFWVDYTVATGPLVQTVVTDPGPIYGVGASGATYAPSLQPITTYRYTQGKLLIDFTDARSGRIFWRGFAAYGMDRPAEVSTAKATEAVGKILRKYPAPRLAGASRPSG